MRNLMAGISFVVSIIAGLLPAFGIYKIWAWAVSQVPASSEWAGLIKVGITFIMLPTGVGISIVVGMLFCGLTAGLCLRALGEEP